MNNESESETPINPEVAPAEESPVQIITDADYMARIRERGVGKIGADGKTVLPKIGESPITEEDFAKIDGKQKHVLAQGGLHAMIAASAKAITQVVKEKTDEGAKLNELVVVLLHMDPREYAPDVVHKLLDLDPEVQKQKCREQKIRVAVYIRPREEFAKRLFGVEGPKGEFAIYDPAANALLEPIEEDRVQVIVFGMNRCITVPLQSKPPADPLPETGEAPAAPDET